MANNRNIITTLKANSSERLSAGDFNFLFVREGENIGVITDSSPMIMSAGELQRYDKKPSQLVIANTDDYDKKVVLVVGTGDYRKLIVSGIVNAISGIVTQDGAAKPDDRVTKEFDFIVTSTTGFNEAPEVLLRSGDNANNGFAPYNGGFVGIDGGNRNIQFYDADMLDSELKLLPETHDGVTIASANTKLLYVQGKYAFIQLYVVSTATYLLKVDLQSMKIVDSLKRDAVGGTAWNYGAVTRGLDGKIYITRTLGTQMYIDVDGEEYINFPVAYTSPRGGIVDTKNRTLHIWATSGGSGYRYNVDTGAVEQAGGDLTFGINYINYADELNNRAYGRHYSLQDSQEWQLFDRDYVGYGYLSSKNCLGMASVLDNQLKIEEYVSLTANGIYASATGTIIKMVLDQLSIKTGKGYKQDYLDYIYSLKIGDDEWSGKQESFKRLQWADDFELTAPQKITLTYSAELFN